MRACRHGRWSDERGTAAVEFAMVAPAFIMLVVGTLSLCLGLFLIGSLHYAVQEGARCASAKPSVCTDSTSITSYAQGRYFVPGTPPKFTYTAAACGNSVSATVSYVLNIGIKQFTIPVSATACYP